MDPFSATANVVAIIGFLGESCQFIITFLRGFLDAPEDIRSHNITLRALHEVFRRVHALCADDTSTLRFSPDLLGH